MDAIEQLEYDRLLNELEYYTKEKSTKSELGAFLGRMFVNEVEKVVNSHDDLRVHWNEHTKREDSKLDALVHDFVVAPSTTIEKPFLLESKDIYRQLVKSTHPDVVAERTDVYIAATQAYESTDVVALLLLNRQLGKTFQASAALLLYMKYRCKQLKAEVAFLEETLSWNWYYSDDAEKKEELLLRYISTKIH